MADRRLLLALAAVWLTTAAAAPPPASCEMAASDRAWIDRAIANWRLAERRLLRLRPRPLPTIYAIDARCAYTGFSAWRGKPHTGEIVFPDGNKASVGPISFASSGGYFAMSLPSVWRAANVESELGLERLMDGVLLHEMMHARQFYFANPALAAITGRYGLPDTIGDDSLQDRWKTDPAYAAAYARERDTLFAAAAAPGDAEARRLAGEALAMLRARHARWFVGEHAYWSGLDNIFLTMEGLGQWLAYAWYTAPYGPRLAPAVVLPEVRRGGGQWSQDEGLALFLVIDRLVPDWRRLAFAEQPMLAEALLAKAAHG